MQIKKSIGKFFAYLLIGIIYMFRPLLGPSNMCPFEIGCTQYAVAQLKKEPLFTALFNIFKRLLRCHPFSS